MLDDCLRGLRVLDLSQYLPGPYAAQLLADLGADVVKLEPPAGDPMRRLGPRDADGLSPFYKIVNAGKRVLLLDLKEEAGAAAFRRLVGRADLLIESFRPGALGKLGFGVEALRSINPSLVHCALSGFGQTGPFSQKGGHDIGYMALGGGLGQSGPAARPLQAYPPVADFASAQQAALVSLAALFRRQRDGRGVFLDLSIMESVLAWQAVPLTAVLRGEPAGREEGLLNGGAACYRIYRTADGRFVSLGALEPKFWAAFCEALGRPEWIERQGEPLPQQDLIAEVEAALATEPLTHWQALLADVDCCFQPVLQPDELAGHPQVAARGLVRELGEEGEQRIEVGLAAIADGELPGPRRPLEAVTAEALLEEWEREAG